MVDDEFPIGCTLTEIAVLEDQEFDGNELSLDRVELIFQNTVVILNPIAETDEIEIIQESTIQKQINTPSWCSSLIGKKLLTVWVCENSQGYQDQVIFAFEFLRPSIAFVAEGSVLKVFRYEQIYKETAPQIKLPSSQIPESQEETVGIGLEGASKI